MLRYTDRLEWTTRAVRDELNRLLARGAVDRVELSSDGGTLTVRGHVVVVRDVQVSVPLTAAPPTPEALEAVAAAIGRAFGAARQ